MVDWFEDRIFARGISKNRVNEDGREKEEGDNMEEQSGCYIGRRIGPLGPLGPSPMTLGLLLRAASRSIHGGLGDWNRSSWMPGAGVERWRPAARTGDASLFPTSHPAAAQRMSTPQLGTGRLSSDAGGCGRRATCSAMELSSVRSPWSLHRHPSRGAGRGAGVVERQDIDVQSSMRNTGGWWRCWVCAEQLWA